MAEPNTRRGAIARKDAHRPGDGAGDGAPTHGSASAKAAAAPSAQSRVWRRSGEKAVPYLLLVPVLALMAMFIYWPLLYSVYLSTLQWNFVSPTREFVGLANFASLLGNPDFRQALLNTGLYLLALVPLLVLLPLGLAMLLWPVRRSRAQGAYRAVLFAPTVVSFAAAAVVWLWILNPVAGLLNQALSAAGAGGGTNWLGDPTTAIWCIVAIAFWKVFGFNLLLYVAALETVPRDYVEAAQLDGAGPWAMFWRIRFPLISPTFFFVLVTTVIFVSDEVFAAISVMTQGGPSQSTTNLLYFLYERGFRFFQVGEASAVALVVFVVVTSVTWLQFRYVERRVHYG